MHHRKKGTIVVRPKIEVVEPKQMPEQKQPQRAKGSIVRGAVPNRICYADAFKGHKPGLRLPRCKRCDAILFPEENHVCPGFQPKYVEHDDAWHERQDAKCEEIRESNYNRPKKCLGCHQVIEGDGDDGLDNARWHDEHCCADMPRGRHWYTDYDPIVGDNDGHECLRGHLKSGQWWSLQNRPTECGLGLGCFTPLPPGEASLFLCANSVDQI